MSSTFTLKEQFDLNVFSRQVFGRTVVVAVANSIRKCIIILHRAMVLNDTPEYLPIHLELNSGSHFNFLGNLVLFLQVSEYQFPHGNTKSALSWSDCYNLKLCILTHIIL